MSIIRQRRSAWRTKCSWSMPVSCLLSLLAFSPTAPAEAGTWIRTSDGTCLVWNPQPQEGETVSWTGACAGGKATGSGTEVFRRSAGSTWSEERYVGEMRDGKLNGRGVLHFDDGDHLRGRSSADNGQTVTGSIFTTLARNIVDRSSGESSKDAACSPLPMEIVMRANSTQGYPMGRGSSSRPTARASQAFGRADALGRARASQPSG